MSFEGPLPSVSVHKPSNSVVVRSSDPFYLRGLITPSKTLDHPHWNFACPWTHDAVQVLRNVGIEAPWPGPNSDYDWPGKYKPMAHQRAMVDFQLQHFRCFNLSEMGTAKTAACLWAADLLMNVGKVHKVLVLCPLSTVERVWLQDIFDVLMHRKAVVVHGTKEKRERALAANVDFYIVNHDACRMDWVVKHLRKRKDIDLVIVDEGSMFRNVNETYKGLCQVIRGDQRVWWVTGTPCPNEPTDAWTQARIINPTRVPQFWGTFRRQTMVQLSQFKWAPKVGAKEAVFDLMQPAIRFMKKDCLDLPPVIPVSLTAPLTDDQKVAFKAMKTFMQTEIGASQITAVNAADKLGKLRQILCGAVKDPETGEYRDLDHAPRLKVLEEVIQGASAKVVVIVPFKGIIHTLASELAAKGHSIGVLNGDVTTTQRNKVIHAFKTQSDPRVLLCHPRVMSHGLNLTEADVTCFYAPIYSNDQFQQVIERFNRAGQKRTMTLVKIGSHPLEWAIYDLLSERRMNQDGILALYHQVVVA